MMCMLFTAQNETVCLDDLTRLSKDELRRDEKKYTALKDALYKQGPTEIAKRLLKNRGDLTILNERNSEGITPIQKLAREGEVGLLQPIFARLGLQNIQTNHRANFGREALVSCSSASDEPLLSEIPLDQIDFSPLTLVQNFCGTLLRLKSGKIATLKNTDAQKAHAFFMKKKEGENLLTAYLSPGHGFLQLDCPKCGEEYTGKAIGFYPGIGVSGSSLTSKKLRFPFSTGVIELESVDESADANELKLMIPLTDAQAKAAHKEIVKTAKACDRVFGAHQCSYGILWNNCVDFVQNIFVKTGIKGHFCDYFSDRQLFQNMDGMGATQYGFIKSRGILPYLQPQLGFLTPQISEPLPLLNGSTLAVYPVAQFSDRPPSSQYGIISALAAYTLGNLCYKAGKALWHRLCASQTQ